jgi:hypothetical protein
MSEAGPLHGIQVIELGSLIAGPEPRQRQLVDAALYEAVFSVTESLIAEDSVRRGGQVDRPPPAAGSRLKESP